MKKFLLLLIALLPLAVFAQSKHSEVFNYRETDDSICFTVREYKWGGYQDSIYNIKKTAIVRDTFYAHLDSVRRVVAYKDSLEIVRRNQEKEEKRRQDSIKQARHDFLIRTFFPED